MKKIVCALLLSIITSVAFGQQAIAKIKFEQAEEAYSKKEYHNTLKYLKEAEDMLGMVPLKILYLRILAQDKVVEAQPLADYLLLSNLRENCKTYMASVENQPEMEDKLRDVFYISEKLKQYPKDQQEFDLALQKERDAAMEVKRKEDEKKLQEVNAARLKREEETRKAEQQRINRLRKVGFFGFRIGLATPNTTSAQLINYDTYLKGEGFATPYEYGKFGLKQGYMIGFSGIISLGFINKHLHPKTGFGLSMDYNYTSLPLSWKNLAPDDEVMYNILQEATYSSFGIFTVGLGPSFTFRPFNDRFYIDVFYRSTVNLITGGNVESVTYKGDNMYDFSVTRQPGTENLVVGSTIGASIRYRALYLGIEMTRSLTDPSAFDDHMEITDDDTRSYRDEVYIFNLNLNYTAIKLGVNF